MKNCTSIEQSKALAEILPPESADMCYSNDGIAIKIDANSYLARKKMWQDIEVIPCWSLAALLDILPLEIELHKQSDGNIKYCYMEYTTKKTYFASKRYTSPLDAAFDMVCWLLENKKL